MTATEQDWLEADRIVERWKADLLASGLPLGRGRIEREPDDLDWADSRQFYEWGE